MTYIDTVEQLEQLLINSRAIDYNGITLYLLNHSEITSVLELELTVRADNLNNGIEKRNHFYEYAKIINPEYPAFKYTLSMKHKKKEIFDPVKVKKAIPAEFEIWKNKARLELQKEIDAEDSSITDSQAKKFKEDLEKEIVISEKKLKEVLDNYEEFDVVISTFEQYTYYPALYYVMELPNGKTKSADTHLRKDVPNLLFYHDERPYSELRANDRMSRIIQTFDRYCENIYIHKK